MPSLGSGDYQLAKDLFFVVGKKHDPTVELTPLLHHEAAQKALSLKA